MKSILVTGGAGFVGSNFCKYVLDKYPDYRVVVIDSLTYAGNIDAVGVEHLGKHTDRLRFWYGNVTNGELVGALVAEADIIIHFAAETHVTRSIFDNRLFYETDVIGTQTIANAAAKSKRLELMIHISTSEVYGTAMSPAIDETHPLNPQSPYASAKCGADRLIYSYWATYNMPCVIMRPFNLFGPRQHLEKLVPRFVTSVLLNEKLTVHGDGSAARDFIFVHDLCRAIDMVIHAPKASVVGEVFNVASGVNRSILEIADDIKRLMRAPGAAVERVVDRPGQVIRHTGDCEKLKKVLGWSAQETWESGLGKTIEWFRDNRVWWERQLWARTVPLTLIDGRVVYH
jgi:dTDP-glucose 4,6-dehydratase